jgi:hypothetical protein
MAKRIIDSDSLTLQESPIPARDIVRTKIHGDVVLMHYTPGHPQARYTFLYLLRLWRLRRAGQDDADPEVLLRQMVSMALKCRDPYYARLCGKLMELWTRELQ